jgi:purine-binding chemotaxis protein CheW
MSNPILKQSRLMIWSLRKVARKILSTISSKSIKEAAMNETDGINSRQYVTFKLENELFGVEVTRTKEILSMTAVTQVPQTPDYLLGVINLRGQVVPVVDMRLKLGVSPGEETEDTCIIVVEVMVDDESLTVGALADAVREVLEIRTDQIEPPPKLGTRLKTEYINGMGKIDEQFVILLNIDRIFNDGELSMVQDVAEQTVAEDETTEDLVEV